MPNLTYISPSFIVADVQTSISFYTTQLGFEVRYLAPDDGPFFAIVGREEISIMLKAIAAGIRPIPNHTRHAWARLDAFIYVSDPYTLFEECRARGVRFWKPLQDDNDGLRGFEVTDADGYVLFFGRPVPDKPSTVPALKKMSPLLLVANIEQSIEFYTSKLGFSVDFRYEDFYAGIMKDAQSLHLKCGTPPGKGEELAVIFSVDNIERLYEEVQSKSVEIVQPLRVMPYGREFYLADPDGNRLAFVE